jgi:hypothetical protein
MVDPVTDYVDRIEDEVKMLKRNLASWITFAVVDDNSHTKDNHRPLPIVKYSSSYNGVDSMEVVSDLSKLSVEAQKVIASALEEWHGAALIQCLDQLGKTVDSLKKELIAEPTPSAGQASGKVAKDEFSS